MCREINRNQFRQASLKLICCLCVVFAWLASTHGQTPEATPRKYLPVPEHLTLITT